MTVLAVPRLSGLVGKRALLSAFRLCALIAAIIPFTLFPDDLYVSAPPAGLIAVAALYTYLKLVQPMEWYSRTRTGIFLIAIDSAVVLVLVILTGGLHSPFMLYAMTPVLVAALLLSRRALVITSFLYGTGILTVALCVPCMGRVQPVEHLSLVSIYLVALGVIAALPHSLNTISERRLKSTAMIDERLRLSRTMHDGLCQTIYGLRWELQMLRAESHQSSYVADRLRYMSELLDEAEQEIRSTMELLNCVKSDQPLLAQIQAYLDRLECERGMQCELDAGAEPDLDALSRAETLNICLEALRNASKHAGARAVRVSMARSNGHLQVEVADDGRGFEPSFVAGHGLMVMKERAESVGGTLRVASAPGTGTRVMLEVPRRCPLS